MLKHSRNINSQPWQTSRVTLLMHVLRECLLGFRKTKSRHNATWELFSVAMIQPGPISGLRQKLVGQK
jgi:hypothetical protein